MVRFSNSEKDGVLQRKWRLSAMHLDAEARVHEQRAGLADDDSDRVAEQMGGTTAESGAAEEKPRSNRGQDVCRLRWGWR
jgi:hypothetical protein